MKRIVARIAVGLAAVAAVVVGLTWWGRPDLLADLPRLPESFRSRAEAPAELETVEKPVELVDDGWCSAHDRPEEGCPDCPSASTGEPRDCIDQLPLIRLSGPDVAEKIGLETGRVKARMHTDSILGNAEVTYNEHAYAEVRPRVRGLVEQCVVDHGDFVHKGDLLAVIDSAEVGTAKADYLAALPVVELAQATLERTQALTRSNALPMKDELEAQTNLNKARADLLNTAQRLRNLGFVDSDLAQIAQEQDTSSLLRLVAPIEGTVIERHAVPGEAVESTDRVIIVADVRRMWAWIDIYENEIERVEPGQAVTFQIGGVEGQEFPGTVEWIDTAVNPATRTIRVRAELENPDGRLRANQFGTAEIRVGRPRQALFVPDSAIQVVHNDHLVFLVQPDGSYRPQRIMLEAGTQPQGEQEVLWGLAEGQEVVTTGSFLLKSELLRDELAGD